MDRVLTRITDRVAVVTLNDPDKRNALDPELSAELASAIEEADTRDDVGAIVVTGAGKGFCAGANIGSLALATNETTDASGLEQRRRGYTALYAPFLALRRARVPTLARTHRRRPR